MDRKEGIMDKNRTKKIIYTGKWLNFTEHFAHILLYKKVPSCCCIEKDIRYKNTSKFSICDVIAPKNSTTKTPVLLYIHGGGWISGVKNMRRPYCYNFSKLGYTVFNIDYDYAPYNKFPFQIQQCLDAVDFIYDNAEKYNLDTSKFLLAGESAGGYFVAMLAAIAKDKTILDSLGLTLKHLEFDVSCNLINCGAVDVPALANSKFPQMDKMVEAFSGYTCEEINHNPKLAEHMSPINYIKPNYPPTMLLWAAKDKLQTESFSIKDKCDKLNIPNKIYKCDGLLYGNHAFSIATHLKKGKIIFNECLEFINKYV